ncbi:MAG: sialate O-acetylesterase [Methylococcaceae bacterium]|nr:sialate O-acetylesterase [Prolixibacteraceae bacterium]
MQPRKILLIGLLLLTTNLFAQDPNFYIFLCFGQSNMEGQGTIETQDRTVDSRFKVMEAVNCSNLGRIQGKWYTAIPPLCRCYSGLSPADYFGRKLVANLPANVRVGIINVSVAGCKIELFDKVNYQTYVSSVTEDWLKNIIAEYGGNPYARLVEMAKLAQKDGVIKGILLHQGESNTGDTQWPVKVKGIYNNLLNDLNLKADSVPLLAGEVVGVDQGGVCSSMNTIIDKLPQTIPTSYVISSKGCTDATDNIHFNSAGYRELGTRYANKMLPLLGYEPATYLEAECGILGGSWLIKADTKASNGRYITINDGLNSTVEAPTEAAGTITYSISVNADTTRYICARVSCPDTDSDSWWVKMDNGSYQLFSAQPTIGWQWLKLGAYKLSKGPHNLTIAYGEDGAKMDKLSIAREDFIPSGTLDAAKNSCTPYLTSVEEDLTQSVGYALGVNYPNPFNGSTSISFSIPSMDYVSLKVYNILGNEVAELAGKEYPQGLHTVQFQSDNLPKGIYFYTLKVGKFSTSRKMILQ